MILRPAVISSTILIAIAAAACDRGGSPTQPTSPPGSSFIVSGVVREKLPSGALGVPIKGVNEIKLFNYIADRKGGHWTTYRVEISYPR